MHTIFWLENLKGRNHMKDLGVEGRIRMDLREIRLQDVDWIYLPQDSDSGGPL
jgi:hypothetical protein